MTILLVVIDIVKKASDQCTVVPFDLTVPLKIALRHCRKRCAKRYAERRRKIRDELESIVRKYHFWDAVRKYLGLLYECCDVWSCFLCTETAVISSLNQSVITTTKRSPRSVHDSGPSI